MSKYIEAEKAIEILRGALSHEEDADDAESIIRNMPAADVQEVRHERWKKISGEWLWKCSKCGEVIVESIRSNPRANYCPNCGAKMDRVSE